jgi:hypothetical protein
VRQFISKKQVIKDVTEEQRIANIIELARPLDRESLGELAGWIAIELGAMKAADEYRESFSSYSKPLTGMTPEELYAAVRLRDDCWKPVITQLPDDYSDVRGNVLPDYNS